MKLVKSGTIAIVFCVLVGAVLISVNVRISTAQAYSRPLKSCFEVLKPITQQQMNAGMSSPVLKTNCNDPNRSGSQPNCSPVLAIFYVNSGLSGSSNTICGTACTNNGFFQGNIGTDFNDKVSSYITESNCGASILFAATNYNDNQPGGNGSEFTGYQLNTDIELDAPMNDQMSSFRLGDNCHDVSSCLNHNA